MNVSDRRPVKHAVAIVIYDAAGRFLSIKRADDDDSLPGFWGLPAVSLKLGESELDAVKRIGIEKLGIEVVAIRKIGSGVIDRPTYELHLSDYEAATISGTPTVPQSGDELSQYVDLKFTNDPEVIVPAARAGSLCSRVYLDSVNYGWREQS